MVVGRLWTVFLAVLALLWLPILEQIQGSNFWDYTQSISSFLNPPIVCTFLVGLLWPRATEKVMRILKQNTTCVNPLNGPLF